MQRANLVAVLEADGDITVVGEATTAVEAIALVAVAAPRCRHPRPEHPRRWWPVRPRTDHGRTHQRRCSCCPPRCTTTHPLPAVEALVGGALLAVPKPARWTPAFETELRRSVRTIRNVPVIRHLRGGLHRHTTSAHDRVVYERRSPPAGSPVRAYRLVRGGDRGVDGRATCAGDGPPRPGETHRARADRPAHPSRTSCQGLVDWMTQGLATARGPWRSTGSVLRGGCVYIGPGGTHLRIGRDWRIELVDTPVAVHRPSADQLFESVAARAGRDGVGVLLTGMGDDGAAGLAAMHRRGARTIVQDEATSAVYGMPRAAMRLGIVDQQLPLPAIADAIVRAANCRADGAVMTADRPARTRSGSTPGRSHRLEARSLVPSASDPCAPRRCRSPQDIDRASLARRARERRVVARPVARSDHCPGVGVLPSSRAVRDAAFERVAANDRRTTARLERRVCEWTRGLQPGDVPARTPPIRIGARIRRQPRGPAANRGRALPRAGDGWRLRRTSASSTSRWPTPGGRPSRSFATWSPCSATICSIRSRRRWPNATW